MAIGGYETPIMYGRTLIFDPTMAAMVLDVNKRYGDALKDERDNAIKNLTTFSNTFGDFSSPFARDMERYGEMVGNVLRVINDAYAHGIDLTRSPEGRLLISQMTNSINPGEYNNMRANAKLGYAYLDAIEKAKAKNEFDQNFENWSLMNSGLGKFEDFSSAGGKIWNRSAPYVYQDLNQYAGHIFDKMEDSFIETGKDHYDYYGVSREAREKALTQHLSGLLSSELGQYHYLNSKAAYENILGRPLSDEEAMEYWQRDILDSTQEYEHRNRKLNEMWKLQYEDASRQRAAERSSRGLETMPQNTQWSFAELVRRSGSTAIMGQQPLEYSLDTLNGLRDKQIEIGKQISDACGNHSHTYKAQLMYKSVYGQNQYRPEDVSDFISSSCGYQKLDDDPTAMIMNPADVNRLHSLADVSSHTTGFRGKQVGTDNSSIAKGDYIVIKPTGGSYQAFTKDATHKNHFELNIKVYKKKPIIDSDGNAVYNTDTGLPKTELVLVLNTNKYFDSHITSTKNDPRSGYLGTFDKKTGKIYDTKNVTITNNQDYKYNDAVNADKEVTDKITKGTVYGSDAIITELPKWAQTK